MATSGRAKPGKRKRQPNHRLVKSHYSYTVEQAAKVCQVGRNTVRNWLKNGLEAIDAARPLMINGPVLRAFLEERRQRKKSPCQAWELYCLRCRAPKSPGGDMAEYREMTPTLGNLFAICPDCQGNMYRRMSLSQLAQIRERIDVTFMQAQPRISDSP